MPTEPSTWKPALPCDPPMARRMHSRLLCNAALSLTSVFRSAPPGGTSIIQWLPVGVVAAMKLPSTSRDGAKHSCYNSMIVPLSNADWSGVTWYQVCPCFITFSLPHRMWSSCVC